MRWLPLLLVGCVVSPEPEGSEAPPDPFADHVVFFEPGEFAGFQGRGEGPDVVLGPPEGAGQLAGSLDVLSLGLEGEIILELDDIGLVDGPGIDLLVFENAFVGGDGEIFGETAEVSVSDDGETWFTWPCLGDATGCAGVTPVYANSDNGIDPTDPALAGGDGFDLADLPIDAAHYVQIIDSGLNEYEGTIGGFDLDAIAVVNGASLTTR